MGRSTSLKVVLAALSIVAACTRKLDDQPCPCTAGWTCCLSQNRCLPAGAAGMCPGDDRTPVVLPEVCTADHWCGATQPITSLWGSADDDIWMVVSDLGGPGSAQPMHFDGIKWSTVAWNPSDVQVGSVSAIWGTARNDVFAAASGAIDHFDGSSWTQQAVPGDWRAFGGTSPSDAWAVGIQASTVGLVGHYDGKRWTTQAIWDLPVSTVDPASSLTNVWAGSPTDAWTVGAGGTILHWDGSSWRSHPATIDGARVTQDLLGVWGSGDKDVWIAGRAATVLHFDGSAWSRPLAGADVDLGALGDTGAFRAVRGSGPHDVWFAGDGGVLIHWDGTRWSAAPSGTTQSLNALWKSPRGDLWAAGDSATVVHGLGDSWTTTPPAALKGLPVVSIRGSSDSDIWVAGTGVVRHWDGQSWGVCPAQDAWRFEKIQVMGTRVALMIGSGVGMREYSIIEGACQVTGSGSGTNMDMHDIWANAPNDIWAVGAQATVEHFDGASWSDVAVPTTADVISVWGSPTNVITGPIYVWALTGGDTAIRWDGTRWTQLSPLTGITLPGVSWKMITGTSVYDTWLVGDAAITPDFRLPLTRHWNGVSWTKETPDDSTFAPGDDHWNAAGGLWFAGRTVLRKGELGWTTIYTGSPGEQASIWGVVLSPLDPDSPVLGPVWVLGRDGSLTHGPWTY